LDVEGLDKELNGITPQSNVGEIREIAPQFSAEEIMAKGEAAKIVHSGFVAQEVEKAAKELDYEFSGVDRPKNGGDFYGLRYAEFVVPLVKAVQELDAKDQKLEEANKKLKEEIALLRQMVIELKNGTTNANLSGSSSFIEQNVPNPFRNNTTIRYHIPTSCASAKLTFINVKGQIIKVIPITNRGIGQINLNSNSLPVGEYNYSLSVDGKQVDTKKLVVAR
jgi:hypothetical protein